MKKTLETSKQKQARTRSSGDDLELINDWLKRRFETGVHYPRKTDATALRDVSKLKETFLEQKLHELCSLFGISNPDVVTVRTSFRKNSLYLRPIYSKPEALHQVMYDPVFQQPFEFEVRRNDSPFMGLLGVHPKSDNKAPSTFTALHKITAEENSRDGSSINSFPVRINGFWQSLSKSTEPDLTRINSKRRKKPVFCLFAGRNKSDLGKHDLKLKHIIAVYFRLKSETHAKQMCSRLQEAERVCDALFKGLELIAAIDAALFRSEGLELVATISPQFAREDVAPADKIAFAVEKLKDLLSLHMVGCHGGGRKPNVFYLAATFEQNSEQELMPRLEMYPHVYREMYPFGSFLVAHRAVPSATKFLLKHYMQSDKHQIVETVPDPEGAGNIKSQKVKLNRDFLKVFTAAKLGTVGVKAWENVVCSRDDPDFLDMMLHDERLKELTKTGKIDPWNALNRNLNPGSANRSIAAFVVEGKTVSKADAAIPKKYLPLGIFAIESEYIDAFSDRDIESLRVVFAGIASLVRQISHQHAPIEYRSRVAEAFEPLVPERIAGWRDQAANLLFLVQKLDGKELKALLDAIAEAKKYGSESAHLMKTLELEPADHVIVKRISKIVPPISNDLSEKDARKKLELRMQELRSELRSERSGEYNNPRAIEFLEACAENFAWVGYLNAMSQSMGDRIDKELPQFRAMSPGYSASGIFMARIEGELRQIVKLAGAEQLKRERHNYRRYVRYKSVNAARIPTNAFAFDTRGQDGRESVSGPTIVCRAGHADAFGVLVSDLVSGGGGDNERVRTFLDVLAHAIGDPMAANWPGIKTIDWAISNVFQQNDKLWLLDRDKFPVNIGVLNSVKALFRLPANRRGDARRARRLDNALSRFSQIVGLANLALADLTTQFDSGEVIRPDELEKFLSIVHGDLNARNLTWADALSSFFMIDFEHVGPGFKGIDQFRLAVNTVTELFSAWVVLRPSPDNSRIWSALDAGIGFLVGLFDELIITGSTPFHGVVSTRNVDDSSGDPAPAVVMVLKSILQTASHPVQSTDQESVPWRRFWAYVLLCAVVKEFEYSCWRVDRDLVETLADEVNVCSDSLTVVHSALSQKLKMREANREDKAYYIRHIIAARLLKPIMDKLLV